MAELQTREGLLGTWGAVWGGGGQKERRENSFIILCIHKSCFVTVPERMLPLFAKGFKQEVKSGEAGAAGGGLGRAGPGRLLHRALGTGSMGINSSRAGGVGRAAGGKEMWSWGSALLSGSRRELGALGIWVLSC